MKVNYAGVTTLQELIRKIKRTDSDLESSLKESIESETAERKASVVQDIGEETDKVMSQNAVTELLKGEHTSSSAYYHGFVTVPDFATGVTSTGLTRVNEINEAFKKWLDGVMFKTDNAKYLGLCKIKCDGCNGEVQNIVTSFATDSGVQVVRGVFSFDGEDISYKAQGDVYTAAFRLKVGGNWAPWNKYSTDADVPELTKAIAAEAAERKAVDETLKESIEAVTADSADCARKSVTNTFQKQTTFGADIILDGGASQASGDDGTVMAIDKLQLSNEGIKLNKASLSTDDGEHNAFLTNGGTYNLDKLIERIVELETKLAECAKLTAINTFQKRNISYSDIVLEAEQVGGEGVSVMDDTLQITRNGIKLTKASSTAGESGTQTFLTNGSTYDLGTLIERVSALEAKG